MIKGGSFPPNIVLCSICILGEESDPVCDADADVDLGLKDGKGSYVNIHILE